MCLIKSMVCTGPPTPSFEAGADLLLGFGLMTYKFRCGRFFCVCVCVCGGGGVLFYFVILISLDHASIDCICLG